MSAPELLALEWTRPLGLLALSLPIAVLLASRLFERPVEIATGTLDLWKRVRAVRSTDSTRSRLRIPLAVWLLAAGLALGALALAGPKLSPRASRELRVLVDRSPSMELPLGAGTRRDRAVEMARHWIDENVPEAPVEWIDRRRPFGPEDDRADTLWVTDVAPHPPPERAGFVASGGDAAPGPIAVDGETRYDWDGERIVEVPNGAPKRRVVVSGDLPRPIADVLAAWAGARGAEVDAGNEEHSSLVVHAYHPDPHNGPARHVDAGRDGWRAKGSVLGPAQSSFAGIPLETWLADDGGNAVVTFDKGQVDCPWIRMEDPSGDPAAFAVSWAKLFDDAVLAPPGVVELGERRAAGDEKIVARLPQAGEGFDRGSGNFPSWLALAATGCVLIAVGLARFGRMG